MKQSLVALVAVLATCGAAAAQQSLPDNVYAFAQEYVKGTRPAIAVIRERPRPDSTATSWFGGRPRVPQEFAWPLDARTQRPMLFVAEVDLAALPRIETVAPLPSSGTLWFFISEGLLVDGEGGAVVRFDPRSSSDWAEQSPPWRAGHLLDGEPYSLLPAGDPLSDGLEAKHPMLFAPADSYRVNGGVADFVSEGLEPYLAKRREQIALALGRPIEPGPPPLDRTMPTQREDWPYAGLYAELAASVVAAGIPPLSVNPYDRRSSWSATGRKLRREILAEAEAYVGRWRQHRFAALTPIEKTEFRAWLASLSARAAVVQTTQTGGYSLASTLLDYTIERTDAFAAALMLERGVEPNLLPQEYRAPFDWLGDDPPLHQMLGHGFSWQDGPFLHQWDVLLLQVEGAEDIPWLPECMLHFWIAPRNLAERRFDRVQSTLECD